MNRDELSEKRSRLQGELDELKPRYTETRDAGVLTRMNDTKTAIEKVKQELRDDVLEGFQSGRYHADGPPERPPPAWRCPAPLATTHPAASPATPLCGRSRNAPTSSTRPRSTGSTA